MNSQHGGNERESLGFLNPQKNHNCVGALCWSGANLSIGVLRRLYTYFEQRAFEHSAFQSNTVETCSCISMDLLGVPYLIPVLGTEGPSFDTRASQSNKSGVPRGRKRESRVARDCFPGEHLGNMPWGFFHFSDSRSDYPHSVTITIPLC